MPEQEQLEALKAKMDSLEKSQMDLLRYVEQVQSNLKETDHSLQIFSITVILMLIGFIVTAFFVALK